MQDQHSLAVGVVPRPNVVRGAAAGDVVDLASWVVALVAARRGSDRFAMRTDVLEDFRRVLVVEDPRLLSNYLLTLARLQVDPASLADLYIPALARMLGEDWNDDRLTFAEVSIGSVRLQSMLRDLGTAWWADAARHDSEGGTLLLAVPAGEQHTLGAMVLLGQLRRLGVSVRLALGERREDLKAILRTTRCDGIFVSVSCTNRLAEVRGLVEALRGACRQETPLIAGGSALQAGVLTARELAEVVGADAATNDLQAALSHCGLGERGARRRA